MVHEEILASSNKIVWNFWLEKLDEIFQSPTTKFPKKC